MVHFLPSLGFLLFFILPILFPHNLSQKLKYFVLKIILVLTRYTQRLPSGKVRIRIQRILRVIQTAYDLCSLYKSYLVPIFVASKFRGVTENGQQIMCLVFLNRSFDPSKLLAIVACLVSRLNSTEQYITLESPINFNHTFYQIQNFSITRFIEFYQNLLKI